jgi:hypothetical protein
MFHGFSSGSVSKFYCYYTKQVYYRNKLPLPLPRRRTETQFIVAEITCYNLSPPLPIALVATVPKAPKTVFLCPPKAVSGKKNATAYQPQAAISSGIY